jgi:hypothetical protein
MGTHRVWWDSSCLWIEPYFWCECTQKGILRVWWDASCMWMKPYFGVSAAKP